MIAASNPNHAVLAHLIALDMPLDAGNTQQTICHVAAANPNEQVMAMLLAKGVPFDQPDIRGITPLMVAASTANAYVQPAPTLEMRDTPLIVANGTHVPQSCAAAEVRFGVLRVRVRGGAVVPVLCHMFKEYLVLPQQAANANVAAIDSRQSHFCAVRFDPASLLVDVADFTFAKSDGVGSTWTSNVAAFVHVPFGLGGECRGNNAITQANIDLRGTPFAIADTTLWFASNTSFTGLARADVHSNRQIVDITVAGFCGWLAPGAVSDLPGGTALCSAYQWQLRLTIANPPQTLAPVPACDVPPRITNVNYQCRDRALPAPPLCPTPPSPAPVTFPGRNNLTVHVACPPLPPPDMRAAPYPPDTVAFASCGAADVVNGLAMIRVRGGSVVQLYCAGGKEYLLLPNTVGFNNYGQIQTIFTFFCAIRLDPATLLVDVGDLTFSSTEGVVSTWNGIDRVGYGYAGDCSDDTGRGKIDLRSTPFAIDESAKWILVGWYPKGNSTVHSGRQIADLSGDGTCGSIVPGAVDYGLTNDCSAYLWSLPLRIADNVESTALPACRAPLKNNLTTGCFSSRNIPLPPITLCEMPISPTPSIQRTPAPSSAFTLPLTRVLPAATPTSIATITTMAYSGISAEQSSIANMTTAAGLPPSFTSDAASMQAMSGVSKALSLESLPSWAIGAIVGGAILAVMLATGFAFALFKCRRATPSVLHSRADGNDYFSKPKNFALGQL
jgi:hypothetical protein